MEYDETLDKQPLSEKQRWRLQRRKQPLQPLLPTPHHHATTLNVHQDINMKQDATHLYVIGQSLSLEPPPVVPASENILPSTAALSDNVISSEAVTTSSSLQGSKPPSPPTNPPSPIPTNNKELGSMMVALLDDSGNPFVPRVEVRRSRRLALLPPVDYHDLCNDNEGDDDEDYVDGS
jgi:hypothetical protein